MMISVEDDTGVCILSYLEIMRSVKITSSKTAHTTHTYVKRNGVAGLGRVDHTRYVQFIRGIYHIG
jgi:hypothetical protein